MTIKKPRTDGKGILDLSKLPLPNELVLLIKSYIPKKWNVPRKPKKNKSKIYTLREKENLDFLDIGQQVKVKPKCFNELKNKFEYFVPQNKDLIGKIVGYVTPNHAINYLVSVNNFIDCESNEVLYKVKFLKKRVKVGYYQYRQNKDGLRNYDLYSLRKCAINEGVYYFKKNQLQLPFDINDRTVCITKKNKVIFCE